MRSTPFFTQQQMNDAVAVRHQTQSVSTRINLDYGVAWQLEKMNLSRGESCLMPF